VESISVWYSLNKRLHIEYMGNCMERNKKISPNDFDDLGRIESVHTITKLSDLKLDFVDNTPDSYTVTVVDTLRKGEESV